MPQLCGGCMVDVFLSYKREDGTRVAKLVAALRDAGRTLRAWVTRAPEHDVVEVGFFNDGPPIPAGALPRIWEPFFTTKSAEEGTGLGLPICRRIVHEHGGEISVASGDGGTSFVIFMPAAHAP